MPVVAQLDLNLALQALLGNQTLHMIELVARQRDAMGVHAIMLGRPEDQPAPAGAYVPEALARLELELFADVIELGLLRLRQAHALLFVVSAGIDAARVQPQRVEIVGEIVMKLNLLGIAGQRVHGQRPGLGDRLPQPGGRMTDRITAQQPGRCRHDVAGAALDLHPAFDDGRTNRADLAVQQRRNSLGRTKNELNRAVFRPDTLARGKLYRCSHRKSC